MLVLLASYVFYAWWDERFLGLLVFSSLADLLIGQRIHLSEGIKRKLWLYLSLAINLGLLGFFKYFNFFVEGATGILESLGLHAHPATLQIILPIGISFYTFQTLSYSIDIYRRHIVPTRDPLAFCAFVSFFPQLVAGPIERARDLLPQFERSRVFDPAAAKDGLRQMLWGFFKKIAIADTCAPLVEHIFSLEPSSTSGITLLMGAFFFAFQIYGDFSGYSDIAIGLGKLFGFRLSRNFAYPYFSRSISEFWRRWHITLSSWFRDYVYLPLGGWRTRSGRAANIMTTFAVSGLWHGANWTFMAWGILHGSYHLPRTFSDSKVDKDLVHLRDLPSILWTFLLVTLAWIFFRSATVTDAVEYLIFIFRNFLVHPGALIVWSNKPETWLILLMVLIEWPNRMKLHPLESLNYPWPIRWAFYLILMVSILLLLDIGTAREFIYFQF
jgi:D-alanyl-lipoteichoic acid acyltransferase DltB (MBOAT superfamily)